jgi:hypothetical protein
MYFQKKEKGQALLDQSFQTSGTAKKEIILVFSLLTQLMVMKWYVSSMSNGQRQITTKILT